MYGGPGTRSDFPVHLHMYKLVEYLPLGSSLRLLRWVPNSDRALRIYRCLLDINLYFGLGSDSNNIHMVKKSLESYTNVKLQVFLIMAAKTSRGIFILLTLFFFNRK